MFADLTMLVMALTALGLVVLAGLAIHAHSRATRAMREAHADVVKMAEGVTASLAMVKGLTPHQARPNVYDPSGASIDAVERERRARKIQADAATIEAELKQARDALAVFEERNDADRATAMRDLIKRLLARQNEVENEERLAD